MDLGLSYDRLGGSKPEVERNRDVEIVILAKGKREKEPREKGAMEMKPSGF